MTDREKKRGRKRERVTKTNRRPDRKTGTMHGGEGKPDLKIT